jgi:hypothetical protein
VSVPLPVTVGALVKFTVANRELQGVIESIDAKGLAVVMMEVRDGVRYGFRRPVAELVALPPVVL